MDIPAPPADLRFPVFLMIGQDFPRTNVAGTRAVQRLMKELRALLAPLSDLIRIAYNHVSSIDNSPSIEAALDFLTDISSGGDALLPELLQDLNAFAAAAGDVAMNVEYTKILIILVAAQLLHRLIKLALSRPSFNVGQSLQVPGLGALGGHSGKWIHGGPEAPSGRDPVDGQAVPGGTPVRFEAAAEADLAVQWQQAQAELVGLYEGRFSLAELFAATRESFQTRFDQLVADWVADRGGVTLPADVSVQFDDSKDTVTESVDVQNTEEQAS